MVESDDAGGKRPEGMGRQARPAFDEFARVKRKSLGGLVPGKPADFDSVRLAAELYNSPAAKLAREYADIHAHQSTSQVAMGVGSDFARSEAARAELFRKLTAPSSFAASLDALRPFAMNDAKLGTFAGTQAVGLQAAASFRALEAIKIDSSLTAAVSETHRAFQEAMKPLGGFAAVVSRFDTQQRDVQKSVLASLAGPLGDVAKTSQWVSTIGKLGRRLISTEP